MPLWLNVALALVPVIIAVATLALGIVRMIVRQAISDSNAAQLVAMNGTYVRSAGSRMTGAEMEKALNGDVASLRAELHELLGYAHSGLHELRNKVQAMELVREWMSKTGETHPLER